MIAFHRLASGLAAALLISGCTGVPIVQQRLVSRPGMIFSDSPVLATRGALVAQLEPGRAAGGAQAAGCTACR
ncbi:MAG: hypothetical protein Q8N18_23120 [Opitutaceae bacterium]|nr:hypothetical protein [Opitutaceae bacterium]